MAVKNKCPECGIEIDARGMRWHRGSEACKGQAGKVANRTEQKKKNKCSHENKRLLNMAIEVEKLAKHKFGYTEICEDCEELL